MNHTGAVRLETERLILRPFEESDAQAMFENWASDDEVTHFLPWPSHRSAAESLEIIRMWREEAKNPDSYNWCIVRKDTKSPIGSISVVRLDEENSEAEIGYCIGRNSWGRGFVPEAARTVMQHLFNQVGVKRITAKHDTENVNSGKVMEKCGMFPVGIREKYARTNLGLRDMKIYAIDNPNTK